VISLRNTNIYKVISLQNVAKENVPIILFTRIYLLTVFILLVLMVRSAWRRRNNSVKSEEVGI